MYHRLDDYRINQNTTCKIHESSYSKISDYLITVVFAMAIVGIGLLIVSCNISIRYNTTTLPTNSTTTIDELQTQLIDICIGKNFYMPILPFVALLALPIIRCFVIPDIDYNFLVKHREQILLYTIIASGLKTKTDWGYFLTQDKLYDPRLLCYINEFIAQKLQVDIQN